jgi:hypothetical protein
VDPVDPDPQHCLAVCLLIPVKMDPQHCLAVCLLILVKMLIIREENYLVCICWFS